MSIDNFAIIAYLYNIWIIFVNKEDFFISCFPSNRIGDDGAVVGEWVVSKDAFFENVHFKRSWFGLEDISYKSMLVNISDAIAMNATPLYALLAVAIPSYLCRDEIRSLYRGFERAAKEFGIEIIGGDTISNHKIDISITVMSKTKKPLERRGLKKGHLVAHTGTLGSSKKALDTLLRFGKTSRKGRFFAPVLRRSFIEQNASLLSCGMDISDGLFSDLGKLSRANRLGFVFNKPISKAVGCSGEEYEMLVGFDPRQRIALLRKAAQQRLKFNIIGKATRKAYQSKCKAHHF